MLRRHHVGLLQQVVLDGPHADPSRREVELARLRVEQLEDLRVVHAGRAGGKTRVGTAQALGVRTAK